MKTFKYLGLIGLAAASLFTTQAFATPTCPTGSSGNLACINQTTPGGELSLAQILGAPASDPNSVFSSGPGIDPYTQQAQTPFWTTDSGNGSTATIMFQFSSNKDTYSFGIFDPNDINNTLTLFSPGYNGNGDQAALGVHNNGNYNVIGAGGATAHFSTTNEFGFFLTTGGSTFYSLPSKNANDTTRMLAFEGGTGNFTGMLNDEPGGTFDASDWFFAWEDFTDMDYNDFLVQVNGLHQFSEPGVHQVPEPAVLGMFGLGALLIGFAVSRRRRENV